MSYQRSPLYIDFLGSEVRKAGRTQEGRVHARRVEKGSLERGKKRHTRHINCMEWKGIAPSHL
jgi:hypothetical protein